MPSSPAARAVAALASLTVLALAVPATAQDAAPAAFAGTADAVTLDLSLTGPGEIMSAVTPDGGAPLQQRVSTTSALLRSDDTDRVAARLGQGPIAPLEVSAEHTAPDRGRTELAAVDEGALVAEAGVLEWAVVDDALSWSRSELALLRVSLAPVVAELPEAARQPLQDAVAEATATVDGLVGELNGVLGTIEEQVNAVEDQAPVDLPEVLPERLPGVADVTTVDLLTARKLWSDTRVETVEGVVRATAASGAAELTLLGGVVRVPTLQYVSIAEAGGTDGTADARTELETIAVEVGDIEVEVSGTILTVGEVSIDLSDPSLADTGLPAQLDEVTSLLTDLVAAGGLSIAQGESSTEVAPDGTSAVASTSPFALRLRPLQAAGDAADTLDLSLTLMQTSAAVSAAAAPAPAPEAAAPSLPRTGGGGVASLAGLLGMGGALLLRRRR